ncbi:MAG: ornithine cyclodeaminase family protein [Candidatus Caldarchaeum sp.]|nr:ornithine cyclodeaminase family protein [Candidatus Caldarchaeum sp.]
MRIISGKELAEWLDIKTSVEIVEQFYRDYREGMYTAPPRLVSAVGEKDAVWLNMPAYSLHHNSYIVKLINEYRQNPVRHGLETASGVVLFFDLETGRLRGMVDSVQLTALRTGGIGGVGAKYMARDDAETVGVIGSGRIAWTQVAALRAVRDIKSLKVYSPTPQNRVKLAARAREELGIDSRAVETARQAVEDVDIVLTATNSSEPVLDGRWLGEGVHVNSLGVLPTRRELDLESFRRAGVIAADLKEAVLREAGDLMAAVNAGLVRPDNVLELHEIVKKGPVERDRKTVTLLKSVGFAALDLFFTAAVFTKAEKDDVGRVFEV